MEKVIREYGGFLLSGFVLVTLFYLIFSGIRDDEGNQGALNMVGAQIQTEDADYEAYTDFDATVADAAKDKPTITCAGNNIHTGYVVFPEYVQATSSMGNVLPLQIISVIDPKGNELLCDENGGADCTTAGIYTITVTAVDSINKRTVNCIKIPVNH